MKMYKFRLKITFRGGADWLYSSIGSDDDLTLSQRQPIIWTSYG